MTLVSLLALASFGAATAGVVTLARGREALRNERAADLAREDAERLAESPPAVAPGRLRRRLSGYVRADLTDLGLPPPPRLRVHRDAVVRASAASGAVEVRVIELPRRDEATEEHGALAIAAAPRREGGYAWSARVVTAPRGAQTWRVVVALMALSTLASLLAALRTLRGAERGTAALQRTLAALSKDLRAPVARPDLAELARVADGVAQLASDLAAAQESRAHLQRALASRERLASLGRVVAGVAHELRNPLASIKLRVDLARMQSSPASPEDLAEIADEVARLDRLVLDLLTLSGKKPGPRAPQDLGALVRQRADRMSPWAETLGVCFRVEGEGVVEMDADGVARAVDNLLRNAAQASPRGGAVRALVRCDAGRVRLTVEDDGPGVPEDRAAELFEPFFTTRPEGTGLGLALARAVAESHGGAIRYARSGGVTRFEIELPQSHPGGELGDARHPS